jgi:hypothetical protein
MLRDVRARQPRLFRKHRLQRTPNCPIDAFTYCEVSVAVHVVTRRYSTYPLSNSSTSCLPRVAFADHGFIMKPVTTKHLQSWSDSLTARADLPGIVASLIHGFDGVAEVGEANLLAVISSSSASTSTNSSSFNPGHPPCRNLNTAEAWHVFRAAMSRARFVYWCMLVRRAA